MKPADALAQVLDADPPATVAALPEEILTRLTEQIVTAKEHQHVAMEASVRTAIDGVPFAVRGIVRKALLG